MFFALLIPGGAELEETGVWSTKLAMCEGQQVVNRLRITDRDHRKRSHKNDSSLHLLEENIDKEQQKQRGYEGHCDGDFGTGLWRPERERGGMNAAKRSSECREQGQVV